jgi:glycosyltransferase involved in cell wall biosynthesis
MVDVIQPVAASHTEGNVSVRQVSRADRDAGPSRHLADLAFGIRAAKVVVRVSKQRAPDVIHVHGDFVDAVVVGSLGRVLGVPVVLTVHSSLNSRTRYRIAAKAAFQNVDGFIAVSAQAGVDLQRLGVRPDRIAQISSGVDLDRFVWHPDDRDVVRRSFGIPSTTTVVSFVGRLHRVKGISTLLEAARSLPPDQFRVLIAGDGPETFDIARAAKGIDHVTLLGAMSRGEVARVLAASDVFVMPSIDLPGQSEGTPTAVIEAMAAGLPIVASDSGGLPGIVRDGENGVVFRQGSATELRAGILAVASDPSTRRRIGLRNVEEAGRRSWPNVTRAVLEFYGRIGVRGAVDAPQTFTSEELAS